MTSERFFTRFKRNNSDFLKSNDLVFRFSLWRTEVSVNACLHFVVGDKRNNCCKSY